MPEPKLELLCAQVEVALEEGDLRTARRMLDDARAQYGEAPELLSLEDQVSEVFRLAGRSTLEGLVQQAQERVRTADYPGAIELVHRAMALYPDEAELPAMLERTEKAAERHAASAERRHEMTAAVAEVSSLLDVGDLQSARQRLRGARSQFGRQKDFDELETRLHRLVEAAQLTSAESHLDRARSAAQQADWHSALNQADLALTLAPGHPEAEALQQKAQTELAAAASLEQRQSSLEQARLDIERLITAGEMARADQRLLQAINTLGREPLFDELAAAIDQAKKDQDFKRRFEWRERRAKEAESLVQEATRRALGGDFEAAVEKLEAASELDPSYPDLEEKLRTHRLALARHRQQEEHSAERGEMLAKIRGHLDALRLDEASALIDRSRQELGEDARFVRLIERLEGLREAEDQAQTLPSPENLPTLGLAARAAIRKHQETVAAAYSWRQACGFAARGGGPLLVLMMSVILAAGQAAALVFGLPDLVLAVSAALLIPSLVRSSLEGKNHVPALSELWRAQSAIRDAFLIAVLTITAAMPALLLVVTRGAHGLFEIGPLGFFALVLLLWAGCWWASGSIGVGLAFGARRVLAPHRLAFPGATLLAISALTLVLVAGTIWLRTVVVPIMSIPLAALLEAYGLVSLTHLIGVMVRSRRLDWAMSYVGS